MNQNHLQMSDSLNQNADQPYQPYLNQPGPVTQGYNQPTNQQYFGQPNSEKQYYNQDYDQPNYNQGYSNPDQPPAQPTVVVVKPGGDPLAHLDDGLAGKARKKFIMKVYLILTIQFLITAGMCFFSMYFQKFMIFQATTPWLMGTLCVVLIIVQIVIFCCPAGRKHPINLIMLLIFTLCEAYLVSYICSIVAYSNGSAFTVIVAACMTLGIVIVLSIYAILTKTDFTTKWGIVFVLLISLFLFGIFCIWSYWLYNLYCMLAVIIFGIYLVIDTQLVVGGRRIQLSMDDYVVGALILYIDIIQIFLYLLALMGRR